MRKGTSQVDHSHQDLVLGSITGNCDCSGDGETGGDQVLNTLEMVKFVFDIVFEDFFLI